MIINHLVNIEVNNILSPMPSPPSEEIDQGTPILDVVNDTISSTYERIAYACTHMERSRPEEANGFQHNDYASFVSVCLGILIVMLQVCRSSLNQWMADTRKKMEELMDKRRAQILGIPTELKQYWIKGDKYYDFATRLLAFYNRLSKIITIIYTFLGYIALAAGLVILYMGASSECSVKTVLLLSPVAIWLLDVYPIRYGVAVSIKIIGRLLRKNTENIDARVQETNVINLNINSSLDILEKKVNTVARSYQARSNGPPNNKPSSNREQKRAHNHPKKASSAGSGKPPSSKRKQKRAKNRSKQVSSAGSGKP